ncbi:MAG: lipocalin-like domain-containing protein [Anaerolineae bacterium]|nr:lipocalin-like domain-containing protein [Anaerolineae bacterium]
MTPHLLAGTWELVTWRQPASEREYPFGPDPIGYVTYHPQGGYVALQVMKPDRPHVSVPFDNYLWMSAADKAAAAECFFGYAGRYSVQGETIIHTPEIAFNPNLVGQPQQYSCHLSGETLTLSAHDGSLQTTWQRARSREGSRHVLPDRNLVGIWKMVSMVITLDGFLSRLLRIMVDRETPFLTKLRHEPIIYPHGQEASGYIMYNDQGYMSAHVMNANRPHVTTAANLIDAGDEEKAQATYTYLSYAGPYTIQADQVIHQPTLSLFPNFVGTDLVRIIKLAGTQLTLSTLPVKAMGVVVTVIIVWKRVS